MAEFQWWLLLVGLVAGGGLVALVMMDPARREQDVEAEEIPAEATWIAERLRAGGRRADPSDIEEILLEHRDYLALPPPDAIVSPSEEAPASPASRPAVRSTTSTGGPVAQAKEARRSAGGAADPGGAPSERRT